MIGRLRAGDEVDTDDMADCAGGEMLSDNLKSSDNHGSGE